MKNIYYVIEKQLQQVDLEEGTEETTGWKTVTVYDIDTQSIDLVVVTELELENFMNSEERIYEELELLDYKNFTLKQL